MTKDEALKLALEALEQWNTPLYKRGTAITAIKEVLAQPEQEPVAWRGYNWGHSPDDWVYRDFDDPILDGNGNNVGQPLYTTPPHRKPLTDVTIWNTYKNLWMFHPAEEPRLAGDVLKFARAIEAAHGIKE